MANSYLTSNLIAPRAVAILKALNSFVRMGNREYEGMYADVQYKSGDTINVRLDNFYVGERGDTISGEDIVEASLPVTINPLYSVAVLYKPTDLQRNIVSFTNEFIAPAVRRISTMINNDIATAALTQIAHFDGDITAPLNTIKSVASLNPFMDTLNMNNYNRNLVIDPYSAYQVQTSSDLRNSFLPSLNKDITLEAQLGRLVDFELFRDTSIKPFVSGTHAAAGDVTISAPVSSGTTIALTGFTAGATVVAGDLLSLEGVYEYDQIGRSALLTTPKQFTVITGGTADGSGNLSITVFPELVASGARQNFIVPGASPNVIPANTVVNFQTNSTTGYMNNVAFTDKGLVLCMPPLHRMDSPDSYVSTDPSSGISMRISKTAEVLQNKNVIRVDAQAAIRWINDQAVRKIVKIGT